MGWAIYLSTLPHWPTTTPWAYPPYPTQQSIISTNYLPPNKPTDCPSKPTSVKSPNRSSSTKPIPTRETHPNAKLNHNTQQPNLPRPSLFHLILIDWPTQFPPWLFARPPRQLLSTANKPSFFELHGTILKILLKSTNIRVHLDRLSKYL